MPLSSPRRRATGLSLAVAVAVVLGGCIALAYHAQTVLREYDLAGRFVSQGLWRKTVGILGGNISGHGDTLIADLPFTPLLLCVTGIGLAAWLAGAAWISRRREIPYRLALSRWARWGWSWWLLPILWELFGTATDLSQSMALLVFWQATLPLCQSVLWAGWLTGFFALVRKPTTFQSVQSNDTRRISAGVWGGMAAYLLCFGAMNWLLYEALLVPHGDSAMYEEHVWNLLHGKGFRSYLDNGRLFLGEHVQVIHLFVVPLYIFWPSHVLLELCQSACLALGAVPVFRIARRHSASTTAATLLAFAYLLYFPMQFLDIAITFKTFRPNSFEIPLFLFALDALERGRYRMLLVWLGMTLLCQEDAATVIAPLGIWIALRHARYAGVVDRIGRRRLAWLGWGLALFGVVYVVLVIKVVLPWFRGGEDVHFARYFGDLGTTSGEIVSNVAAHPGLLLAKLLNVDSALFALNLLVPLGLLPLLSPGRLSVGLPLFAVLCLSQITNTPFHHFHAPLVPIVFWAAAAGLAEASIVFEAGAAWWRRRNRNADRGDRKHCRIPPERFVPVARSLPGKPVPTTTERTDRPFPDSVSARVVAIVAFWGMLNALFAGMFVTLTPLGVGFWDPDSRVYWRNLYVAGERARSFPAVLAIVPPDSRVASTDYIHPRFTHHARSYDYSLYRPVVPEDAEYIVIDTRHPYSRIKRPEDVKEYRDEPEKWELLDDGTQGYFIVLKRRATDT